MASEYTEQDQANEGCCWDYKRQLCPGKGCLCNCHATNEEILLSDRAKLRYANTRQTDRIAALTAENAALRAALAESCEAVTWLLDARSALDDPGPGIRSDLARWRTVLAPANSESR